jgi:hypothetical protein
LIVERHIRVGKTVLGNLFRYYDKMELDDAEYIPVVRVIIEGIGKALTEAGAGKKDVKTVEETLKRFNRDLYLEGWLKNSPEDLGESVFDVYKYGTHPR